MGKRAEPVGVGVGVAAIAAAGACFVSRKRDAKGLETITGWALQMKGEVLQKLEDLKEIDEEAYHGLVDRIARRHRRAKRASAGELKRLTAELKAAWPRISRQLI